MGPELRGCDDVVVANWSVPIVRIVFPDVADTRENDDDEADETDNEAEVDDEVDEVDIKVSYTRYQNSNLQKPSCNNL